MVDSEGTCIPGTVYNMAYGTGVKIGDSVAIPEPFVQTVGVDHKGEVGIRYLLQGSVTSCRVLLPPARLIRSFTKFDI